MVPCPPLPEFDSVCVVGHYLAAVFSGLESACGLVGSVRTAMGTRGDVTHLGSEPTPGPVCAPETASQQSAGSCTWLLGVLVVAIVIGIGGAIRVVVVG